MLPPLRGHSARVAGIKYASEWRSREPANRQIEEAGVATAELGFAQ